MSAPITYTLAGIRQMIMDDIDHQDTESTDFIAKMTRLINRKLLELYSESGFNLSTRRDVLVRWEPDYTTGTVSVVSTDPWVWELVDDEGWTAGAAWAGRTFRVYSSTDMREFREYTILDVWQGVGTTTLYLSVDRPHYDTAAEEKSYRIYWPGFPLPHEIEAVDSLNYHDGPDIAWLTARQAQAIDLGEADRLRLRQRFTDVNDTNTITYWWTEEKRTLPSIHYTPTISSNIGAWAGPESPGTFKFMVTYGLGQDDSVRAPSNFYYIPRFESSRSNISDLVTVSSSSVRIYLPEIAWQHGFNTVGTTRRYHGGFFKRLYVARVSASGGSHPYVEAPEVFYHLADVAGHLTSYDWDGSVQPNYFGGRYITSHGRHLLGIYPRPREEITLRLSGNQRVPELQAEADSIDLPVQAVQALVARCVAHYKGNIDNDSTGYRVAVEVARGAEGQLAKANNRLPAAMPYRRHHYTGEDDVQRDLADFPRNWDRPTRV
jgi:hypothetical protein